VAEADAPSRGRALVDLVDFAASDAAGQGAKVVQDSLEPELIDPWDEAWVLPELGRATLEALLAWQIAAKAMLDRLEEADDTETMRELRDRLTEALEKPLSESYG
jgi:hypothetical protein